MTSNSDIEAALILIRQIAAKLLRRLPSAKVEMQELINDGFLGLRRARERFDPSRGVPFRGFAAASVRGAMLDGLRARDAIPRYLRRSGAPVPVLHSISNPIMIDHASVEEQTERREWITRAVQFLPRRSRLIIQLYDFEGCSMELVGRCLGVSEANVSQIRTRIVQRLRTQAQGE